MDNFNIVGILGTGLAGFGFLLMYLAYRLIRSIATVPNTNPLVFTTINRYMLVCFVMTLAVGVSAYMTAFYKKETIADQEVKIEKKDAAINILATNQGNTSMNEKIGQLKDPSAIDTAKEEQKKTLDTLAQYVASGDNPTLQQEFKTYETKLLSVYDSLKNPALNAIQRDSLHRKYIRINNSISNLSIRVAKSKAGIVQK